MRMHSGMVRKCSDNDRGMLVDTDSVALSTDILPASSAQIGRHASTSRRAVQQTNEPVLREPDRLSVLCPEAQVSAEWDAPGQRTRNGVPTRPRIPRNGVVVVIIMGRPPFGLELAESSGSNVRPFATSEHYRHRNSERNPFSGKPPELHSQTG